MTFEKHGRFGAKKARTGQSSQTVEPNAPKAKRGAARAKPEKKRPAKTPARKRRRASSDMLEESMYLEAAETEALFKAIKSKRDTAIFRVVFHRGLRAHEVGLLQLADFKGDELFVHRGKGSRSQRHSLTAIECHALRMWIKERGRLPGALFPSRNRKPITRSRLDQLMKKYCALAGIPKEKAHMHALKHSCGTQLAERGESADGIKDHLGHKDLKSTDIYMHFTTRRRKEMALRLRDWR